MPIYEYACEKCQHEFEAEQRITDEPLKTCPSCRRGKVKRLISQTSFVLKGGGWYSDLYSSRKDEKKSEKGDKGDSGAKDSSADKKESKKAETKDKGQSKGKGSKAAAA